MAKTGRPGGRQGLENTRTSRPQGAEYRESAPEGDRVAAASIRKGSPNTNRIHGDVHRMPPEVQKEVPSGSRVSYPSGGPNTNRKPRGAT